MAAAAHRAARRPDEITLVAVTKTVAVERMRESLAAGITDFGESYYQEVRNKLDKFTEPVRWHFIGHLQTNKARYLVGRFALIHSVDSLRIAQELGRRSEGAGIVQNVLIEVRLDQTGGKTGPLPGGETDELVHAVAATPGLRLAGLMGMAPFSRDPESSRGPFRLLRNQFESLPAANRLVLSMGMSGDFEVAIEEGATHIRVGSAIFGERPNV